jgi:uncharacterized membrane protein YbhN (UPF0104 family)/membrane-associated phospholipid phosphatase
MNDQQPPAAKPRSRTRLMVQTAVSLVLVVAIFYYLLRGIDLALVWAEIRAMTWTEDAVLALIAAWNLATYALVWMSVTPGLGFRRAMVMTQAATAVTNTVPTVGPAIGVGLTYQMLGSWGVSGARITVAVLVSGVWNAFAKLGLPILALALVALQGGASGGRVVAAVGGIAGLVAAIVVFALLLRSEELARRFGLLAGRVASRLLGLVRRPPVQGWELATVKFRTRTLELLEHGWVPITAATLVSHLSLYVVLLACLRAVGVSDAEVSWAQVLLVFAFARLATAIPITPGGAGVVELVLIAGLTAAGGDRAQVTAAVLVYRALTWALPILVGIGCYLWWRRTSLQPQPATPGPQQGADPAAGATTTDRSGAPAGGHQPQARAYVRHPSDVLRVVLGALILLATMTAIHQHRIGVREANLFRLINDLALPGWTRWPIWGVMQLGVIGAVPLVAALALVTRRVRLALYAALAGGTIYLVAKLVKAFVQRGRPQTLLEDVHILFVPDRGLGYVSGHSAVAVALATVASPFLGRRARRVAWTLAGLVCVARIYVGSHLPFDVLGGAALGWAAGALVLLVFGAPTGHPSLDRVRSALERYGFDPADLAPLPGQDRRSARYLASSHSRPDLFVKVVTRERRDSDLLYRAWSWLAHRGRPPSRLGDAVAQVEHEATMGLLAATAGVHAPPVLLVRSFGNGAGLLVQQRVAGRDLTDLDDQRLDQARLDDLWQQIASLRAAGIAHRDLGRDSVMMDERGEVWLVDFDRAEAAASQALLDRDLATLLAALDGVADPALVRATAEQALGQDTVARVRPMGPSTPAAPAQAARGS